jgi:transposase-like protein
MTPSQEVKNEIIKLYNERVSVKDLSKKFKIKPASIYNIIREARTEKAVNVEENIIDPSTTLPSLNSSIFKFPKTEALSENQQLRLYKEFIAAIAFEQWLGTLCKNRGFND